ncbi:CPBP family intramembrane glutamic endopeptidase [Bradyrhizobium sp.]|uniref:CPBP family intramembrane glutamic endopeptidase n=1 Tax=Bradyrhizobium sp. TaxID=376 RepID=UPI00238E3091|nr:CPBP family intramembrane glutamic endopeptidase [Bradyrhizobium sp.]MDE2378291.1 CPBP family intramembrane metalloprotease [Bradyrhizobium sp.]
MDSLNPEHPPPIAAPAERPPRVWQFWGTALWGLVIFAAMFVGQIGVVVFFVLRDGFPIDVARTVHTVGGGLTIALSVVMGLPAVLGAAWLATHFARMPFADYLALRWTSWKNVLIAALGLTAMVGAWDLMSRATGREITPGFMVDVFKTAQAEGVVWLLVLAFCVAAPVSEEIFARGFLYRGWSQTRLGAPGAIVLSSLAWTSLHLQYDWYFFGEVFCIGLWLGYMRYRSGSTWLTIVIHGLNNSAAVLQTFYLASQ